MSASIFRPGLFAGQTILITGGGSGIGRCLAHELHRLGAGVALWGRTQQRLEQVAAELGGIGPRVSIHACDVREADAVTKCVAATLDHHSRLDGVVNNAGGQFPAKLEQISERGWDAVVRNNLHSVFLVSRACYAAWFKEHGGAIVNVLADFWGSMPMMGHSGAARAGAKSFTETAALEWAPAGVRVNAIAPGWIRSSGLNTYDPEFQAEIARWPSLVPLQRLGTESEVAAAIVFLLSPAAAFITGTVLRVDGGVPNVRAHWPAQAGRGTVEYHGDASPAAST